MIKQTLAVAAMAVALQSLPAAAASQGPKVGYIALQKSGESLTSEFIGTEVKNGSGEVIGRVVNLMFGQDGRIASAVLAVGGFAGIGGKKVAVPFDTLTVAPGKDGRKTLTANLDKKSLQTAPVFQSLYDQEGGVTETTKRELSKWGKKALEAAKDVGEKAKEAYTEATKPADEKKPAQ